MRGPHAAASPRRGKRLKPYLDLLQRILDEGVDRPDRTGTGTRAIFGAMLRFDLAQGFPLVTTKRIFFKGVVHELLWFLRGESNLAYLHEHDVHIWDEWADERGELGPVYGVQWRSWRAPDGRTIDQIAALVRGLRERPHSRRHLVSAWNVADLPDEALSPQENVKRGRMALAPCHVMFQFFVADGRLSCMLYQRSADAFLGLPFNIASYSLLTCMLAQVCGYAPGEFVHVIGDAHLYHNHFEQARTQLARTPRPLPRLVLDAGVRDLLAFRAGHIALEGYDPHPHIPAPVAV